MEPNVPPCSAVTLTFELEYTILPFNPDNGSASRTADVSYEILDLDGNLLASQGPKLPGTNGNGKEITGNSGVQTSMTTAGQFIGGVVLSIFDDDNDGSGGTFSGTMSYTLVINVLDSPCGC